MESRSVGVLPMIALAAAFAIAMPGCGGSSGSPASSAGGGSGAGGGGGGDGGTPDGGTMTGGAPTTDGGSGTGGGTPTNGGTTSANPSSSSGSCPGTPCPAGQECQSDGTCAAPIESADGGIAACTSEDVKPVGDSALLGNAAPQAYVITNRERHTVGEVMSFVVPQGTASITIVEQAIKAPNTVTWVTGGSSLQLNNTAVPHTVNSPDGSISFNHVRDGQLLLPDYTGLPVYFFSVAPVTGTLTIPNTTKGLALVGATGLPGGTWTAQISDYAYQCAAGIAQGLVFDSCSGGASDSMYDVTVIAKPTSGGIPGSGTLDVVLNLVATTVDGQPLNANAAPADTDVQRMVQTLQALYAKQSITVNVTYQDAPPTVQQRYASGVNIDQTGACSDLSQLFTTGVTGKNVLNIFLVPTLVETTTTGRVMTVGIDGTIPGPASIGGTVASGAVVSAADLRSGKSGCGSTLNVTGCGADETAYIIAHEAGHFLGLYHLTEKYGFEFDPLAGTPTCKCTSCSRNSANCFNPLTQSAPSATSDAVTVSECLSPITGCGGGDNLMFWLIATGSVGNLVDEQGQVMRANPAIH